MKLQKEYEDNEKQLLKKFKKVIIFLFILKKMENKFQF
jgi:hypothetical protein